MSEAEFVNIHGEPVDLTGSSASFIGQPRAKRDQPQQYHRGWRVECYPPGQIEAAQAAADQRCADWAAMPEAEQSKALSEGRRKPAPWVSVERYVATTKRAAVRAKPYEIPEAAETCRQLAIRAGWAFVEVVELKREKA